MKNKINLGNWRTPEVLLLLMAAAVPLSFSTWQALINNFAFDRASFTGVEIGIMQSLREVPGFLAFAVVFLLLFIKEQPLAILSLLLLGIGTAITGFFPSAVGIYFTTVLGSLGYHYHQTLQASLSLQWIKKENTPELLGRLIAVGSVSSILVYGLIWIASEQFKLDYIWIYGIGGGLTILIAAFSWLCFPKFEQPVVQNKHMVLRKRYWLYYGLTFLGGARRQIFVVFASFLMVEKFGYDVGGIAALFLLNSLLNIWFAPKIGRLIARIGERRALVIEYVGLVPVFVAYAWVDHAGIAAGLYVIDHFFFALAIAMQTYFQKIADPADIASTAGVSFTINHIAAVIMPVVLGFVWLTSPEFVFLFGALLSIISLIFALNVPRHPEPGREVVYSILVTDSTNQSIHQAKKHGS